MYLVNQTTNQAKNTNQPTKQTKNNKQKQPTGSSYKELAEELRGVQKRGRKDWKAL